MFTKAKLGWIVLLGGMLLFGAATKPTAQDAQIAELQKRVAVLQFQELMDQQEIARQGAWINYFYGQLSGNGSERMQERDKTQDKF